MQNHFQTYSCIPKVTRRLEETGCRTPNVCADPAEAVAKWLLAHELPHGQWSHKSRSQPCFHSIFLWFIGLCGLVLSHSLALGVETLPQELTSSRRAEQTDQHWYHATTALGTELHVDSSNLSPSSRLALDAREVACQAACRWPPALGLRQRAHTVRQLFCNDALPTRQAASAVATFLQLQAAHQEDIGAASAMRAYYSQIGIAEQQQWIHAAGEAIELQEQKQHSLMEQGLAAVVDLSSLQRKNLDLQDQWLQSVSQLRQLRKALNGLTGREIELGDFKLEPLTVQAMDLDCHLLVAQAFRERADLLAWQQLSCQLDEQSASMVATILSSTPGSFGLPIPTASLLKRLTCQALAPSELAENLKQELCLLIQTQKAYIEQDVHEKCEQLHLAYQRHEIELQRIENWSGRIEQLDRLGSHGQSRPEQRMQAEAGLLESRSTEVTRRLEVKLAEVALAESVGGLAIRCCRGLAWLPTGFQ